MKQLRRVVMFRYQEYGMQQGQAALTREKGSSLSNGIHFSIILVVEKLTLPNALVVQTLDLFESTVI